MMDNKEHPVILILEGDYPIKNWLLDRPRIVVGRDETCDIVIPQRQISRQHIIFHRNPDNKVRVEDLKSKNGTWVNGLRLDGERELYDGDEIHLALMVRLKFIGSGITAPVTQDLPDVIPFSPSPVQPTLLGTGNLQLDPEGRRVFIFGQEVNPPLSLPQYRLLELLYANQGRVCTRDEVVSYVWPDVVGDGVSEQAIDALVRRLRDRLGEIDESHNYVLTVRGHGFRLDNPNFA
jgi:pSer/pThr/pTyr-binding forkhead associated (FHA) protein